MKICPETARLTAFREGWLEADEEEQLLEHLEECEMCRHALSDLDALVELIREESGPVDPPPGGYDELLRATMLMRDRIVPLRIRSKSRWLKRAAVAAALLLVTITGITMLDTRTPSDSAVTESTEEGDIPDFLVEEHALATDSVPFSNGGSLIILVQERRR